MSLLFLRCRFTQMLMKRHRDHRYEWEIFSRNITVIMHNNRHKVLLVNSGIFSSLLFAKFNPFLLDYFWHIEILGFIGRKLYLHQFFRRRGANKAKLPHYHVLFHSHREYPDKYGHAKKFIPVRRSLDSLTLLLGCIDFGCFQRNERTSADYDL